MNMEISLMEIAKWRNECSPESLYNLMLDWEGSTLAKGYDGFNADGAVYEDEWFEGGFLRIMFLMRETNGLYKPITEYLREEGHTWVTWSNASVMAKAVLDSFENKIGFKNLNNKERQEIIDKIAVVNVKKVPGGSSSDEAVLNEHFQMNEGLLRTEIEMLNPDVIIAGGTITYLDRLFEGELESKSGIGLSATGDMVYRLGRTLVLAGHHPSARDRQSLTYYSIVGECLSAVSTGFYVPYDGFEIYNLSPCSKASR